MPKYISGRVKTTPVTGLTSDRYRYLSLADAEPSLGDPTVGPSSIGAKPVESGTQYIIVAVEGRPGERYWIQNQADVTPGSISVFEEGVLVGGLSSTTQLDFRGAAITAEGLGGANPGYAVTITFAPPGNETEVIFKESNDFATDATFTFDSSINLLAAGDRITVGAGGTVITTTASGFVGIGTTNPIGDLTTTYDPNLHVEGNIRLTGTIIDRLGDAGDPGFLLVKEDDIFGGLSWTDPANITFGGAGDYRQVQFKGSTGLLEGADLFYYDEVNNFVGIGSTQPTVILDVIGTSNFDGNVTIEQNLTVTQLATFNGNIDANGNLDVDGQTDLDVLNVSQLATFSANLDINASVDIQNNLDVGGTLDVTGATDLASAGGITTTGGDLYVGNDLYVAGNFNIDDLEAETGNFTVSLQTVDFEATGISTLGNVKVSGNTVDTTGGNLILQANAQNNAQAIDVRNRIVLNNSTQSTAVDNGSFETTGGVGIAKNLNVGGEVSFTGDGSGVDVTLASAGGITTTGGDLYVGGDLYTGGDFVTDNITAENGTFTVSLTSASLTLDNPGIAVTAILDEDNMISNRDDALATQQSIKTYVDTQVGNQDLDFSGDSGTGSVDLDTEVFDVSGFSGDIVTSASAQTLTIRSDVTGVVAGTYGSATRVGIITVNDRGKITAASDIPIDLSDATAAFADRLTTPRTISFSEDVVAVGKTFDGSQDVGFALTLTSVFDGGTYGGEGNKVLSLTVDDKGRITGITSVEIDFGLANVATADSLTNAREIAATGDIDWSVSFKGHEDVSGTATLSNTGVTSDTYGSSTQIPIITVDAKGRITGVGLTDVDDGGDGSAAQADKVSTGTTTGGNYFLTFVDSNNNPRDYESLFTSSVLQFSEDVNRLTISGDLNVNDDVTLGSDIGDTVLFNAYVGSDIVPGVTETYDLGSSASLRWGTVYANTICADNYCGALITGNATAVGVATTNSSQDPYYLTFVADTAGVQPLYTDSGLRYFVDTDELALQSNLLLCDNASICIGDSKEFRLYYDTNDFACGTPGDDNRYDRFSCNLITNGGEAALFEETGTGPMLFKALGTGQGAFQFFNDDWETLLKIHAGVRGFRFFQNGGCLEVLNVVGAGLSVQGNIVPWAGCDGVFDLGSPTKRWNNVYATNVCATNLYGTFSGSVSSASSADQVKTQCNNNNGTYYLTFVDSNNSSATSETEYTTCDIQYFRDTSRKYFRIGTTYVHNRGGSSPNTIIGGSSAGCSLTSGNRNVIIGRSAGEKITTGYGNIAIGEEAGSRPSSSGTPNATGFTGNSNIMLGYYTGGALNDGCYNALIGHSAGENLTSGCLNVFLGLFAGRKVNSGCYNTLVGSYAGCTNTSGGSNTYLGYRAGDSANGGNNNVAVGRYSGRDSLYNIGSNSNKVVIGYNSTDAAYVKVAWTTGSDIRCKCVWGDVPHGREFLRGVNPIKYSFKDEDTNEIIDESIRYGFSAQEILALEGNEPVIASDRNPDLYTVTSDYMIPVLVNAIKELDAENTELKQRIVAIEQHLGL